MKLFGLNSAEYIKCKFIDFMLSKNYELIIGNELMYGIKRKLVDLVVLKNNKIFAVEIKSNSDNLNRLKEQIEEYKKVFNYVLVVTTEKFKNRILDTVSSDIGVYIIKADLSLHKIRSPRIQNDRNKIEILYSINAKFLSKIGHYSLQKYNADEIRLLYANKRISYIQEILLTYLLEKYKDRFNLFMRERGIQTHIEDLEILSSSFQIE